MTTPAMDPFRRPLPVTEVAYFRDAASTWFGAEIVRADAWDPSLALVPDMERADIRVVLLRDLPAPLTALEPYVVILPAAMECDPAALEVAARAAWPHSPWFRPGGPSPEAYLKTGFQALCPPHPPCAPGPGMRESLMEFVDGRPGALGRLAGEGRDAANRLLRVFWSSPGLFVEDLLRERIRDEGGRSLIQLTGFLEAAEVAPEAPEFVDLAMERAALLARLHPLRYFTHPVDYDRAAALALDWRGRYSRAYLAHYRHVLSAARATLAETAEARALLPELEHRNRGARPVGEDATRRLQLAVEDLAMLPERPDGQMAMTGGVTLGRMPGALAEARLAAAAVLAAVDVHRRRGPWVAGTPARR
jgi:hypothetical protein